MSRVLWSQTLVPDFANPPTSYCAAPYSQPIENVRAYPVASADISIPDPKAFRSMSRAAIFLSHLATQGREAFAPFQSKSPFAIGIYCAVENGPIDGPSTQKIIDQNDPAHKADHYRKFRNPKMYLKQLPNLAPAQLGISLGLQGPMNVYTHSTAAALHALDQAEWDLARGNVMAALVCTAHAFDDYVIVRRTRHDDPRCLNEAGGALLLAPGGERVDWTLYAQNDPNNYFGISDPLINVLRNPVTQTIGV